MDKLLFENGNFTSAGGLKLDWKIECDALSDDTLYQIAKIASARMPRYNHCIGVPRGGTRVARAMQLFVSNLRMPTHAVCVCEDVWTTGSSWYSMVATLGLQPNDVMGFCLFSRSERRLPDNVFAFMQFGLPNPNNRG